MASAKPDDIDDLTDAELVEQTVQGICETLATTLAKAWELSPRSAILGTARALGALCLRHLDARPSDRDNVLVTLRSLAESVEIETAATTPTRTH